MSSLDHWKKALQSELKLAEDQVEARLVKKTLEGIFPILSTSSFGQVIPNSTPWKKASQTYSILEPDFIDSLKDDLANGVRVFFFNSDLIGTRSLEQATALFERHEEAPHIEVVLTGKTATSLNAQDLFTQGCTHLQELTALTMRLIRWCERNPTAAQVDVMVSTDEHFFQSVAKLRAFREISEKVFLELNRSIKVRLISRVNLRGWTLYDRYNNMLRNSASVGAALIGGADLIESLGYMAAFEADLGNNILNQTQDCTTHRIRARRMARNTIHVLSLESMLGMVQDAGAGSYHLETLTNDFASNAWREMQRLLHLNQAQENEHWARALRETQAQRLSQLNHRKLVMSGINDFPNTQEKLSITGGLSHSTFRLARAFEELRMRVELLNSNQKPTVRIALWGDYAALNARLNFTKNYFELLGLQVLDPGHTIYEHSALSAWLAQSKPNEILALCARDEDYPVLQANLPSSSIAQFVAGKVDVRGFEPIFAGQNVYEVLSRLVARLEVQS